MRNLLLSIVLRVVRSADALLRAPAKPGLAIVLAACELQPAPKQQPAPAAQPAKPVEPPPAPAAAPADAGPPAVVVSPECLQVGAHVAQVFVTSATDTAQKSVLEQERGNIVRKTGEACTLQGWSDAARTCFLATKTPADIKSCETRLLPTRTPPPRPPTPTAVPPGGARVEPGAAAPRPGTPVPVPR